MLFVSGVFAYAANAGELALRAEGQASPNILQIEHRRDRAASAATRPSRVQIP